MTDRDVAGVRPLRVALVYLGRRGGGAAYARLMAEALAPRCALLAAVSADAENVDDWRALPVPVVAVPTGRTTAGALLSLGRVDRLLALRARIRAHAPDVVYVPMGHPWTPALLALLPGVPRVVTIHDPVLHLGERNPAVALMQRALVAQATRAVVLTRGAAGALAAQGFPADAIDVIPHGELSSYARGAAVSGPAPDGETLLFFGRIARYKGVDVLLEAFAEVRARRPSARLLLVGEGDLGPYAARLAALPGVEVVNRWVPDGEVHGFFARAAVVVLPYVDASQSGVVPLASGLGLPAVATRVGGLPDQVDDGRTGLLVPPGDAGALAAACLALLGDPARRAAMGRAAAERAAREWSWDSAAARALESLRAAAETGRAPRGATLRWPST